MKRLVGFCVMLSMLMLLQSPTQADESKDEAKKAKVAKGEAKKGEAKKAKGNKKGQRKRPSLAEATLKKFAAVELTETQKAQIKEIATEFQPKLQEAQKKLREAIPAEQLKARREALAKAKAEGKKPREVTAKFKPSEEQIAAQKQVREVQMAFGKKVNEVLTDEQRQTLRKNRPNAKKPGRKKKAEDDAKTE